MFLARLCKGLLLPALGVSQLCSVLFLLLFLLVILLVILVLLPIGWFAIEPVATVFILKTRDGSHAHLACFAYLSLPSTPGASASPSSLPWFLSDFSPEGLPQPAVSQEMSGLVASPAGLPLVALQGIDA